MQGEYNPAPFESELSPGESILWTGQPDPSRWFTAADWLLIPISLVWFGFAILWEFLALEPMDTGDSFIALGMGLIGIPFILVGLYLLFGRFWLKAWQRKRTFYAVTNQRVLILTTGRYRNLTALEIKNLPTIEKTVRRDGSGSIYFGSRPRNVMVWPYYPGGPIGYQRVALSPTFEDIQDVERVDQILKDRR